MTKPSSIPARCAPGLYLQMGAVVALTALGAGACSGEPVDAQPSATGTGGAAPGPSAGGGGAGSVNATSTVTHTTGATGGAPPAASASVSASASTSSGVEPSAACADLVPAADPATNRAAIQGCLDAPAGLARLRVGATFDIDAALVVDAGDVLEGSDVDGYAEIRPAVASAPFATFSHAIVNVVNGGTLRHVKLDLRDARPASDSPLYGVRVAFDGNHVEHVEITSTPMPWRETRAASLYFGTGFGNRADEVHVHHAGLAVVFVNGNTAAMSPWVDRALIEDNRGDAVTFAGYGKVTNSVARRNGFDDGDSGEGTRLPPGGAFYASYVNQEGGWIENNVIHDQCGTNLELNGTRNFTVLDNEIYDPGWPGMNGTSAAIRPGEDSFDVPAGFCKAAMSALVIATSGSSFRGNVITNVGRAANTSGNSSNGGAEEWFGPGKSDLPAPESTSMALAFVLGKKHAFGDGVLRYAVGNEFVGNHFASYGAGAGSSGLGWFAGRSTGFGPGGAWDATTTANVFNDNSHCDPSGACSPAPFSKRCGDNRHATGTSACASASGANLHDGVGQGNACNRDDFKHEGPGHDARRNDGCAKY